MGEIANNRRQRTPRARSGCVLGLCTEPVMAIVRTMGTLRIYLTCCLLLVGTGFLTGCATTGHEDASTNALGDTGWEDMTTAQKVCYCMWWPLQVGLYFGGTALASQSNR